MEIIRELSIPKDIEGEQALLGSIIEDNERMNDVISVLKPETFFKTNHQYIFRAMVELFDSKSPIDEIALGDKLRAFNQLEECGGYAYLSELADCCPSNPSPKYYAKILKEHALLRELINITSDIGIKARDPEYNVNQLLNEANQKITEIATDETSKKVVSIKDLFKDAFEELEKRSSEDYRVGIPTGLVDLDKLIGGLIAPDMVVIAARTSVGKTAIALNILENAYTKHKTEGSCFVVSREMSNLQNLFRIWGSNSKVEGRKLATGKGIEDDDWARLSMSCDRLSQFPIYFNDSYENFSEIAHAMRTQHRKQPLSFAMVDYLQLVKWTKDSREQEIAEISRGIKSLCKELNIPIIALSQLNRSLERRSDKRPELSDLRESGSIEQDADIIIFIYRDEVYDPKSPDKGIAELLVKKHRNGPTGMVKVAYISKFTRFENLSQTRI